MKTVKALLAVLLFSLPLQAQTNVDRLVQALESLTSGSLGDWKVSPDLKSAPALRGDPTTSPFDDSSWETLRAGRRLAVDSCWLRKEIILPDRILGHLVAGEVKLTLRITGSGSLWINGESKGSVSDSEQWTLTRDAQPGRRFLIVIKATNADGYVRIAKADLELMAASSLRQMVRDLILSLRVGQKLLSSDTYQTNARLKVDPGADKSNIDRAEKTRLNALLQEVVTRVDTDALRDGPPEKFIASLGVIRPLLKPVGDFAKRFTLYFNSNAHIDAAWLWREKETVEICRNTFSSVLNIMNEHKEFTYTQSAAAYYVWMQEQYPDLFKRILDRIKEGRWEAVGGMWVEPDCHLPSGESWMHHLLYGQRYFQKNLGARATIGWIPDSFGYNWNMPQFYLNAGLDAFVTQKIGWSEVNVFPHRVFWWEAPNGVRLLTYFPFDYVNLVENPFQFVDWLRQFEANTGFTKMLVLFGVGDHGGGPSLAMLREIDRLKTLDIYPTIEYGTTRQYIQWLRSQDLSTLPVWRDELYLEYHQGTYTTQAKMKMLNRENEALLSQAEKFSTLSTMYGRKYNNSGLEDAWSKVLFNQFHDILPGSGIREVYLDATEKHQEAKAIGNFELRQSLAVLARQIDTAKIKGTPVVVFNPLGWERTDLARLALPEGDLADYAVFNRKGEAVPSQVIRQGTLNRDIIFIAERVPSLGYDVYELRKQKRATMMANLRVTQTGIENEFFRVGIDASRGWLNSVVDKRNGKVILSGEGNRLQLLEDRPRDWDAWNIGLTGVEYPSTFKRIEVVESGPVRAVLRVHRDFLKPGVKRSSPTEGFPSSFFTQDIILYSRLDRIDFKTDVDWWEDHTMLKVAFPVLTTSATATHEIPYGTIERSTEIGTSVEKAKSEVPAARWADLSGNGYGVSLLNNSKYGNDIKGNVMRLSLLRSPRWPDPTADRGKHSIEYALYPHAGGWREANTVQKGYEFNEPLIALTTDAHRGTLPQTHSFVQLTPATLVLTVVKKAEDSEAWIVQWYDAVGADTKAVVKLPRAPKRVVISNFLEDDGATLPHRNNEVTVETKKNSVVTIKVSF
jgi:alpha-mannosidase